MEKLNLTGRSKHSTDDSMRGLSAVLMDGDEVFVDNGAIHGKSRIEHGIQFLRKREEVPDARLVHGFWVTLHRFEEGQGYYGLMPFELYIDDEHKVGFKRLGHQVNGMEKAVKGMVSLDGVPDAVRERLRAFLKGLRSDLWDHAQAPFLSAFATDPGVGGHAD